MKYTTKSEYETKAPNEEYRVESTSQVEEKVSTGAIKTDEKKVSSGAICIDFD